jgi:AraC family transcriptional regulator of adaptative response/methylated-DNA-[protein]-cysteine methyltransferase
MPTTTTIHFTTAKCPLGRVLLAATAKGVCVLSVGDSDESLEAELRAKYPNEVLTRADKALKPRIAELTRYFAGEVQNFAWELDAPGTKFQRRVWDALVAIPYGETRSYKQIAEAIGKPDAVRAVGSACGANPIAIVVPCHRVIGSDGKLHGYAGGLHRKEKLLAGEGQSAFAS